MRRSQSICSLPQSSIPTKSFTSHTIAHAANTSIAQNTSIYLRYDGEFLFAGDGTPSLSLPTEISPRVGVIYDPNGDHVYSARRGHGAMCNKAPIHASAVM